MNVDAPRKKVAAIVTEYRHNAHAEVIVGRLIGAFDYVPRVDVVSLYTDQVPHNDLSREASARYGVRLYDTIAEAVAAGGTPIDGVIVIGEHGDYPYNEKGQKMYPRRRLLEHVLRTLDETKQVVPIFLDKHLAYDFADAMWMYEEMRRRRIPFMGGSSIPHTPLVPQPDDALFEQAREVLVVSWGEAESYGFHAMEVLQRAIERRVGGETGIAAIEALEGDAVWQAIDRGEWPEPLLLRALAACPEWDGGHPRHHVANPVLFRVDYTDGATGYVLQLQEYVHQWGFALRTGDGRLAAARHESGRERPFSHFERLTRLIEDMIVSGKPPFPPERTLLTTGMIDFAMESLYRKRKVPTPELNIRYAYAEKP